VRRRDAVAVAAIVVAAGIGVYLLVRPAGGGSSVPSRSGDLMDVVARLVDEMPRPDSNGYHPPTPAQEHEMASVYRLASTGDLAGAAAAARPLDYDVVRFTDTRTRRRLVLIQERQRADGSWPHAWGTYVVTPSSSSHLLVEVPHALDDIDSWVVGVDTFRLADAAALLVAGASRFAGEGDSDMAHSPDSVFEAIHEAALTATPGAVAFEPHGFDTAEHTSFGDIVVSNGTSHPDDLAASAAAALRSAGFSVCLYDGEHCAGLGATTNVQGQAIMPGDHFLHVEMAERIRTSPELADRVAEVIARVAG